MDKIENPYLNAHLHINMNSHIYFQENPSRGLGGVAITNFYTEVLWMVNIGQKYQKRGTTERKRAKIENPYLNAHLHINMNSHIYFQENPSRNGEICVS